MPQKKTAKRAKMKKTAPKRQANNSLLALAEKIEKEFRQIPTKLAQLYRRDLMAQKEQESKLKAEIKKAEASQKLALKKQADLMKAKPSKSTKKQLATAKKSNEQATKMIKLLTQQLTQAAKNSAMLLAKQNKFTALGKELVKLEKQLATKAATIVKAKKATATKGKSAKPAMAKQTQEPAQNETMSEETPFMISSKTEIVEL